VPSEIQGQHAKLVSANSFGFEVAQLSNETIHPGLLVHCAVLRWTPSGPNHTPDWSATFDLKGRMSTIAANRPSQWSPGKAARSAPPPLLHSQVGAQASTFRLSVPLTLSTR